MVAVDPPVPHAPTGPGICIVLNALTVSGGVKEAVALCRAIPAKTTPTSLVIMWETRRPVDTSGLNLFALCGWIADRRWAPIQLPWLMLRFAWFVQRAQAHRYVFTHFSTYPLSWLIPRDRRYYFVQGIEWNFLSHSWGKRLLCKAILHFLRNGRVFVANGYIKDVLAAEDVAVEQQYPVWASALFLRETQVERTVDVVMVLRHGRVKRLDLYRNFVALVQRRRPGWRLAVISPDADLCGEMAGAVAHVLQSPTVDEMADLYSQSKVFLLLSDEEGFGLPPLESMAAGCIPVCRDCGGVRTYMNGQLLNHLVPQTADVEAILTVVDSVLARADLVELANSAREIYKSGLRATQGQQDLTLAWLIGDHD